MQRLGIVDLGSNTARLVVYTYESGEWFRYAHQIREPVRLGEGLGRKGVLSPKAMERGCSALRLFSEYARSTRLSDVVVLGTSAPRAATNRHEFLAQVTRFGHEISILSGEQEARLGVLVVANGYELEDACVMDLGGGSAQVSWMCQRLFSAGRACPLGAVRLTEHLDRTRSQNVKDVKVHISDREVRLKIEASKHPSIELWESEQQQSIFRSAFGLRVVFEPVIASASC